MKDVNTVFNFVIIKYIKINVWKQFLKKQQHIGFALYEDFINIYKIEFNNVFFFLQGAGGPCPVGHFCPQGTSQPQPCPEGTFSNKTKLIKVVRGISLFITA